MSGRNIEPFPRGVLVAQPAADTTFYSDPLEVGDAKTLAWWFETLSSYPASVTNPATAYVETSNVMSFKPWNILTPAGINPSFGTPETGVVQDPMKYLRVRMVVLQGEAPLLEFRIVARDQ